VINAFVLKKRQYISFNINVILNIIKYNKSINMEISMKNIFLISAYVFLLLTSATSLVKAEDPCSKNDAAGVCDCSVSSGNCQACIVQGKCGW